MIERFHYTLKSGCKVEQLQVDDAHALMNTVSLYLPVAWRIMSLTHLARTDGGAPAAAQLTEDELAVLAQAEGKAITTVEDAILAIAKLGGWERFRKAPAPGVKSLWLGLRRLDAMVAGWRLAMQALATPPVEGRNAEKKFAIPSLNQD